MGSRDGVVPVNEQCPGRDDPVLPKVARKQSEARIAFPQDGSLAGAAIHENIRKLAQAIWNADETGLDVMPLKFPGLQDGGWVVAHGADVARRQSPATASDQGAGDLAAGKDVCGTKLDLRVKCREARKIDNRVGGVDAHAGDVDDGGVRFLLRHGVVL